jgi:hypothetical protein
MIILISARIDIKNIAFFPYIDDFSRYTFKKMLKAASPKGPEVL